MRHTYKAFVVWTITMSTIIGMAPGFSMAKVLHVSVFGSDANPGTANSPLRNIQTALSRAAVDDTIKVAAGTYTEGFINPAVRVILLGGYSRTFAEAERDIFFNKTVILANSTTMLMDTRGCTIDGFVFDGNNVAQTALDLRAASKVTHNLILRIRQGVGYGANISGAAILANNTIDQCLRGVNISGAQSSAAIVKNNMITHGTFGILNNVANTIHRYNDVFGNSINYSFTTPGAGDIDLDPQYLDVLKDDFRVKTASPAIDAGDPFDPVGEEPEPNGKRIDMGAYGGTKNATPKIIAPVLVSPADSATGESITPVLSWNPVVGATAYRLQVATAPTFFFSALVFDDSTITAASKQVGPLKVNTTFYWRVRAKNSFGASAFSNVFQFTTTAGPAPPQNLQALAGDRQVTLTWAANTESDFLRYRIYFEPAPNPTTKMDSVDGSANTAKIIQGLNNGVTYYFRLTAVNSIFLESGFSNEVSATPVAGVNQPPFVKSRIPDQALTVNGASFSRDLSEVFSDPDGDGLAFSTSSSAPAVAAPSLAGNMLTVAPKAVGKATITVTANDGRGGAATDTFNVDVNPSGSRPTAVTNAATNVSRIAATLNGAVNPNGLSTAVVFQYGTTTSYGNEVAATPSPLSGTSVMQVTAALTGLSPNTLYHYRLVATNGAGTTNGDDQTLTTLPNQTPLIAHTPVTLQPAGQQIIVQANVTDDDASVSATLSFRRGGESSFTAVAMSGNGTAFQATIPASAVTSRGVEYFMAAMDVWNAASRLPSSGVFSIQVRVENETKPAAQPNGTEQTAYRLISVPLDLDNKNAKAVLEDDLGKYDDTKWRFSELSANQTYVEISDATVLIPGKAFWLLVKEAGKFIDTGAGKSNLTSRPYAIPLHPAWNFVANPFNFPIPVTNLGLQSGKPLELRSYSGAWNDPSATPVDMIMPFEGYAVFNELSIFDTLLVNPGLSNSPNPLRKAITATASATATKPWSIRILAQCQQARDVDNLAAIVPGAEIGFDAWDRPEPPPVGEYVSVSFPHRDWAPPVPSYCIDARPEFSHGEIWEFEVATNIRDKVNLAFDGVAQVPPEFAVWLVDEALNISQNLRENDHYAVAGAGSAVKSKRLKLVVGQHNFVAEKLAESESVPTSYELSQNFPNPFNPVTTIRYGLPKGERVTLKVFNLLGEEVVTLVGDEQKEAGYHAAIWDGRNAQGRSVASGVYFYQLRAGSFVQRQKMALVR